MQIKPNYCVPYKVVKHYYCPSLRQKSLCYLRILNTGTKLTPLIIEQIDLFVLGIKEESIYYVNSVVDVYEFADVVAESRGW